MKFAVIILSLTVTTHIFAKTIICSNDKLGIIQIDQNPSGTNVCLFNKKNNQWLKVESGKSTSSNNFYDAQSNENKTRFNILTNIRNFDFSMPTKTTEQFTINVNWSMPSHFGPLISAHNAEGMTSICFVKENINPCQVEEFKNPANTPKNFNSLKNILEQNENDWWGEYPTITLVSPDLNDFIVFTKTINGNAEVYYQDGSSTSFHEKELVKSEINSRLSKKWTLVPVYSNDLGIKYFKSLK